MGIQTEATVRWGLHLDCDEVLAIIKALEEQEKERIEQEKEKEKSVQDNRSSSTRVKLEDFMCNLVPEAEDLEWRILAEPEPDSERDSEEGPTAIIYTSIERRKIYGARQIVCSDFPFFLVID